MGAPTGSQNIQNGLALEEHSLIGELQAHLNDPYKALKTSLKAEIDEEAWASLNSDTSRPFDPPANGRIAVKVINHLGDEVMKVFRLQK